MHFQPRPEILDGRCCYTAWTSRHDWNSLTLSKLYEQKLQRTRAQLEASIRSDPLRSVAIAAGVGFLAAVVLRRL